MQWGGTGQVPCWPKSSPAVQNAGEKVRNCADTQKLQMGLERVIKEKCPKEYKSHRTNLFAQSVD